MIRFVYLLHEISTEILWEGNGEILMPTHFYQALKKFPRLFQGDFVSVKFGPIYANIPPISSPKTQTTLEEISRNLIQILFKVNIFPIYFGFSKKNFIRKLNCLRLGKILLEQHTS
jgi:hypothetical protein